MTFAPFRNARNVVPRWRPLAKTIEMGEMATPAKSQTATTREISSELRRRLEAWRAQEDIITASEVIETAIVEGNDDEGIRPARKLMLPNSGATPLVREQASLLLRRTGHSDGLTILPNIELSPVARARRRTRAFPNDAYAWTDLALAYLIGGKNVESQKSILTALQLAPNDRHVLRSAARLFLHLDDPERAHDLLKQNEATRYDPWLMAGEIAISEIADRNPATLKYGTKLIDDGNTRPRQISELASAIGTIHLRDGNRKARKLFTTSLIDPTGNSLAQAEWANPHINNLVRPQALVGTNDSAEARVFQAYWNGNFPEVIKECEAWHFDEGFSSRPHQFGSGAALTIEKFDEALEFAENGLQANPNAMVLHNNRAFALISLNRFDEALSVLRHCLAKFPEESKGALTATAGLLAMRLRQFEEGTKRYREAISHFKRTGNSVSEALAQVYFAQEAARADLPEAAKIIQTAGDFCKNIRFLPEAGIVFARAKLWLNVTAHRKQHVDVH